MLKKYSLVLLTLILSVFLTACNTTKGVGKDIESGGKAIQRGVDRNSQ